MLIDAFPKEALMRTGPRLVMVKCACNLIAAVALTLWPGAPSRAEQPSLSLDRLLSGVVHIKTFITPDGRTTENLGKEREGTGIVIDNNGLILTLGYLLVEA